MQFAIKLSHSMHLCSLKYFQPGMVDKEHFILMVTSISKLQSNIIKIVVMCLPTIISNAGQSTASTQNIIFKDISFLYSVIG